jgi:serine/threonine protein kinase
MHLEGKPIGPYMVSSRIGAGGMGNVYKARDTRLDRTVAIKVLTSRFARDPQSRERFEVEARAAAALNHPHICTVHDIGRDDGVDFLVMEYLEGETLAARLEKGPLPLVDAVRYAVQIASALDRAHRAGIVHRDLKPGNVMLTATGAKLLDFGLAKSVLVGMVADGTRPARDLTEPGLVLGTLHYMAPEQLEGRPVDARADLFAFGAVLFEMLTARKAFDGSTPATIMTSILERDAGPLSLLPPHAPPFLHHILKRCLAKDPDQRWQTARDVMLELESRNDVATTSVAGARASDSPRRRERTAGSWLPGSR